MVADHQREVVRIVAREHRRAEQDVRLRRRVADALVDRLRQRQHGRQGRRRRASGQAAEQALGQRLRGRTVQVADQRQHRVARHVVAAVEVLHRLAREQRHGFRFAIRPAGVGVRAVGGLIEGARGDLRRLLALLRQGYAQRALVAGHRVGREVGAAEDASQQVDGRLQQRPIAQRAQRHHRHVALGLHVVLGAEAFETAGDGLRVQAAGALEQQAAGEAGQAGRGLVARGAGIEGHAHVDHRQIRRADQQHPGAVAGGPGLDRRYRAGRPTEQAAQQRRGQHQQDARPAAGAAPVNRRCHDGLR